MTQYPVLPTSTFTPWVDVPCSEIPGGYIFRRNTSAQARWNTPLRQGESRRHILRTLLARMRADSAVSRSCTHWCHTIRTSRSLSHSCRCRILAICPYVLQYGENHTRCSDDGFYGNYSWHTRTSRTYLHRRKSIDRSILF